jgi:hypothetical protein
LLVGAILVLQQAMRRERRFERCVKLGDDT